MRWQDIRPTPMATWVRQGLCRLTARRGDRCLPTAGPQTGVAEADCRSTRSRPRTDLLDLVEPHPPRQLARCSQTPDRLGEALAIAQRDLARREVVFGPNHPELLPALKSAIELHCKLGDRDRALLLGHRSLAIARQALGDNHLATAEQFCQLARIHALGSEFVRAELLYQCALDIYSAQTEPDRRAFNACLDELAALYRARGEGHRAAALDRGTGHQSAPAPADRTVPSNPGVSPRAVRSAGLWRSA